MKKENRSRKEESVSTARGEKGGGKKKGRKKERKKRKRCQF